MYQKMFLLVMAILIGVIKIDAHWNDYELAKMANLLENSTHPFSFDLRAKRVTRVTFGVSGTTTVNADLHEYQAEVNLYHSAKGNEQYTVHPLKVQRIDLCKIANNEYRKFLMNDLKPVSDLPTSDDESEDLCDLFEMKEYTVTNFQFDKSRIPQLLQPGLYKLETVFYKDDEITSGLQCFFKLAI